MSQIKTVGIILRNNQNIRPAFAYVEKILRSKFSKYDNFKTIFFSKSGAENLIILQNYTYSFNLSHLEWRGDEGNGFSYFSYFSLKLANFKVNTSNSWFWWCQTSIFELRAKFDVVGCDWGTKLKITQRNLMPQFGLFYRTTLLNHIWLKIVKT